MRKLTTVGLLLLVFVGLAMGQVGISLPTQTAATGAAITLPVGVTGFNSVGSFSLQITFDKNVLTYTGLANAPSGAQSSAVATANTNGRVDITWFSLTALNIGSGKLLDLLFTYNGGTSALTFTNTNASSITDSLGNPFSPLPTFTPGGVSLVGPPVPTIKIGAVTANPGEVFVPVTAKDLSGIGSISLRITYDPSKVTFLSVTNAAVPFTVGTPSSGVLALTWFDITPFSLADGKLADLRFTLIDGTTNLTVQSTSQITNATGSNVTVTYENGSITKTPTAPVGFSIPTQRAVPGASVALPINVVGMSNIGSISLKINYDAAKLTFTGVSNFAGTGQVVSASNGVISFAWFGIPQLNIGTGKLMDLGFTYASGTAALSFNQTLSLVTDSAGNNLALTLGSGVVNQDSIPKFTAIAAKTVAQLEALSFTTPATDADAGEVLTYSAGTLPSGAAYDPVTKTFSWTPAFTVTAGVYSVTFHVTDAVGGKDSITVPITVTKSNQKPVFANKLATATVPQADTVKFTYTATDANSDPLTYTLVNPPAGAAITAGGAFTWAPSYTQVGEFTITAVVSDGFMADTAVAVLTVTKVNVKPAFTAKMADTTVAQLQALTFSYAGSDVNGDAVTFSLFDAPAGAAITAAGAFTWTPTYAQVGAITITAVVSDGSLADTAKTVVTVTKVNQKPAFVAKLADTSIAQNASLAFAYSASDANLDVLTYSLVNAPAGATITAAGAFSWTPTYAQVGAFTITAVVSDGALTDTAMATVTVGKVNQKPVFVAKLADTTIAQDVTLGFAYSASDPNADALTYSLVNAPTGATMTAAGAFSWKPSYAQSGAFAITAVASDGALTDTAKATVTVTKVNVKPVFAAKMADSSIAQNVAYRFTYTATDPNLDALTFSLVGAPAGATMTAAGVLSWTPTYKQLGAFTITAVVTDGALTDTAKAILTVTKVNVKPAISFRVPAQPTTVSQKVAQTFAVSATDPNGDALTYVWKVNDVVVKPSSADSFYTVTFADAHGVAKAVTAVVSDGALTDTTRWTFTITDVAKDEGVIPTAFGLDQNYPNPFNPSTTIRFDLPKGSPVTLEIYNILGVKVRTLMKGQAVNAGRYTVVWDGKDEGGQVAPSGIYLYRISAADFHSSKKMTLVK